MVVFAAGVLLSLVIQGVFILKHGDVTSLLHVGAQSDIRQFVEADLGDVALWDGLGHDGRFSYAIAREPLPPGAPGMDEAAYRYRRYLYSLLGGAFGMLPAEATVWGLVLVAAVGVGTVAAAGAALARLLGIGPWSAAVGLTNLGAYNSALQLTSDALAFGLTLAGVVLWMRDRRLLAVTAFVLGVWTKEVYLLLPLGVALWETWRRNGREAVLAGAIPTAFVLMWSSLLVFLFPDSSPTNDSFVMPFTGIVRAWTLAGSGFSSGSQIFSWLVLGSALVLTLRIKQRLLLVLTVPWGILAVVSHEQIWYHDSIRAFAPLTTFAACALVLVATAPCPHASDHCRRVQSASRATGTGRDRDR